jgi:hypothetical protein
MASGQPQAGWYADPTGKPGSKYWDGSQWHDALPATTGASSPYGQRQQPDAAAQQQYAASSAIGQPALPNSHLVMAVLSILACWPFGIVAVINSTKVSNLWALGKYDEAQNAANQAKKWSTFAFIGWACVVGLVVLFTVVVPFLFVGVLGTAGTVGTHRY